MEKMIQAQSDRRSIMNMVIELMGGDFKSPEHEALFVQLDNYVCGTLKIDTKKFPDHTI